MTVDPGAGAPAAERAARHADGAALGRIPALGSLAAGAAVADLLWNRLAVPALHDAHAESALWLLRTGAFVRNLVAVAGLVALVQATFTFLRMAGFAGVFRRLELAGLSGLLLPALVLATLLPKEQLPGVVVLLALGVGNALVVVVAANAASYRASPLRPALALTAASSGVVLTLLATASLEEVQRWLGDPSGPGASVGWLAIRALRACGELLWVGVPIAVVLPGARQLLTAPRPRRVAAAVALLVVCGAALAEGSLHPSLRIVAYAAFRVTLLPEAAIAAYALPLGLSLALAAAWASAESGWRHQAAAAVSLWIAAGFSARSPVQLLDLVLAALLLARAAQASDPDGLRRAALAWGEPLEPPAR